MTRRIEPASAIFTGADGNKLAADVFGERGGPVLLLHGGGQTRHAWGGTAARIARNGMTAYALDQRGHGDSDWIATGAYTFPDFAKDAATVADELARRSGVRPIAIGASLGGVAALMAEGLAEKAGRATAHVPEKWDPVFRKGHAPNKKVFSALVLVDITPRVDGNGVAKIQGFMRAHAQEGFATVAEAADAVAAYLPHRPRPRSHDGLKKNLRLHPDGRWRWHWDPRFLDGPHPISEAHEQVEAALIAAAKSLEIPALLVRGASSELVQEAHAREFLDLVPHAEYADVSGARHMVAGDKNDQFSEAILGFLGKLESRA